MQKLTVKATGVLSHITIGTLQIPIVSDNLRITSKLHPQKRIISERAKPAGVRSQLNSFVNARSVLVFGAFMF